MTSRRKEILSSEDELAADPIQEPARYEFQSFLSDDEEMPDASPESPTRGESPEPRPPATLDEMLQAAIDNSEATSADSSLANGRANGTSASFTSSFAGRVTGRSAKGSAPDLNGHGVRLVDIEVGLSWLSPSQRAAFEHVEVEEYIPSADYRSPRRLRTRHKAAYDDDRRRRDADDFNDDYGGKRKRKHEDDDFLGNDFDEDDLEEYYSQDEDDLDAVRHRRTSRRTQDIGSYFPATRASTRASSRLPSTEGDAQFSETARGRRLRPRSEIRQSGSFGGQDDKDELQGSDHGDDPDFSYVVQSDIVKPGRRRKKLKNLRVRPSAGRRTAGNSDIEFEARRSNRATKNTHNMDVSYADDDDEIFYVEENKAPANPKVVSMREVFQPVSAEFKEVHRDTCDTCGLGENAHKGPLIPCQGCSVAQHKVCLNSRSQRDQRVTKIDADSFVVQCRFCLCIHAKNDPRAPRQDTCQKCHTQGDSCAPFSEKKTAKQEETLRVENGGVDPITPVPKELVNNPNNPLFRCCRCHRAWHYEHLPHPNRSRDPSFNDPGNLRKHRLEEYRVDWTCKECRETEALEMDRVAAWRPVSRDIYTKGQTIEDFTEDQIEYLIKWVNKSYSHCQWLPGAWAHGVMKPAMRKSFVKRTLGEMADEEELQGEDTKDSLLRWHEKDAILNAWITPEIILEVQYATQTEQQAAKYRAMSRTAKFEYDLDKVLHVTQILVKFEGLGYEDVVWDSPPDAESPMWDAFLDAYREYLTGKHFRAEPPKVMRERLEEFRTKDFVKDIEVKEQPKGLKPTCRLMAYQLEGLNWMLHRLRHGENAILADEMGLGKTVQVVALLSSVIQDNPKIWPFLIVVPNATCANWRREIKKWAPDLRVVAYYGGRIPQQRAREFELFPNKSAQMKAHVVIMSYDSIKDPETKSKFNGVAWQGLVVDEAQALKNDEANLYKALKQFRVPFKLLLTGTPLQNNKRELFNLLQFVDPKIDATELDQRFETITKENLPELHNMIRPYFLRRTKAGVLTFLPPMSQIIIPVSMSILQERLCKSIMSKNPDLIRSIFARGKLKKTDRGPLSNILMQLRKCLCHPFVYSQAVEDRSLTSEMTRRNLIEASSKLVLLQIMLPKLKERGHRVLIFSQFLEELTILEDFLMAMELKYERLDGSQSSLDKQKRIDAFNAPDSKLFCMLLSTRAGGVGINLATADTVIIMDPDWNPHQDIQALSRAHRIGQKKKVLCFQLMTVGSAEEKIMQIGRKKMALDHLLIESMDEKEGENLNDVESVLKHGAAALFGEGQKKEAIKYDDAAVEKLLDRSAEEETRTDGAGKDEAEKAPESAFAFARVWTQEKGELSDDLKAEEQNLDPSVWESILKEREEEARREAELNQQTLGRGNRRRNTTNYTSQRFDFEDGQDAPMDSDRSSADEEFVGGGESDGGSTDEEGQAKSPGELSNGTNPRKQTKQESDPTGAANTPNASVKASDTPKPALNSKVNGKASSIGNEEVGNAKVGSAKVEHQEANIDQGPIVKKRGRPKKNPESATTSREGTPGSSKDAIKSNKTLSQLGFSSSANGIPSHTRATGLPGSSSSIIRGPSKQPVVVYVGGRVVDGANPQPAGIINDSKSIAATSSIPPAAVPNGVRPASAKPSQHGPAAVLKSQNIQQDPCLVCGFLHPASWECPEMGSEINIRIAIDKLRRLPNQDKDSITQKKLFLLEKLMLLKSRQS
ncbi:PHD/FYVE-zinc-finger like domain-containing protein [Immersiella caudata]|uniref:PHD/FYVE-zinc-finger like domain-containing protein n=1 Tax=Immersiella caudata TaxID=314043 RepID=A0AA39WF16_9PEZI|nr:PHD/FYVE-zinc-finger like domain-containing protein [Immersiella caudata]